MNSEQLRSELGTVIPVGARWTRVHDPALLAPPCLLHVSRLVRPPPPSQPPTSALIIVAVVSYRARLLNSAFHWTRGRGWGGSREPLVLVPPFSHFQPPPRPPSPHPVWRARWLTNKKLFFFCVAHSLSPSPFPNHSLYIQV